MWVAWLAWVGSAADTRMAKADILLGRVAQTGRFGMHVSDVSSALPPLPVPPSD